MEYTKKLLAQIGLDPQRLEMINMSSAMGGQFAEAARMMAERIAAMPPNPLRARRGTPASEARDPDEAMRGGEA